MTNCPPATGRPGLARVLHPHQLHALAAMHSLRVAWQRLREAQRTVATTTAVDTVQAWRPRTMVSGGGFSVSGLDTAVLDSLPAAEGRYLAEVVDQVEGDVRQARWLALSDLATLPGTAAAAIESVAPMTARDIAGWLRNADKRIRRVLLLEPDVSPVQGDPACPVCTVRMLRVQHSAPDHRDWTIVCGIACRCSGDTCPCDMDIRERGAPHIWPAANPFEADQHASL
jgi:hypothetical protein